MTMRRPTVALLAATLAATAGCAGWIDRQTGADLSRELQVTGLPATATVLEIWETGVTVNDMPVVGFRLRVRAAGRPPWEAETRALISILDIPRIQPGAVLSVMFDPEDPARVALGSPGD